MSCISAVKYKPTRTFCVVLAFKKKVKVSNLAAKQSFHYDDKLMQKAFLHSLELI